MTSTKNPAVRDTPKPTTVACCVLESPLNDDQAVFLANQLKALADPVRLRLFSLIAASPTGDVCACELPGAVDRSQPTVSHHLGQLVEAGLLEREQRGKWAWFRVADAQLAAIRTALGEGAGQHPPVPAAALDASGGTSCCG